MARALCTCARASSVCSRPARRGHGQDHPRPLHHLPWPGPREEAKDAGGEDPRRHRRRYAHPLGSGNGEPGVKWWPSGRPSSSSRSARKKHEDLRTRRRCTCITAHRHDHGSPGRQHRRCRWAARPRSTCPKARSTARPSACAARASGRALQLSRAICTAITVGDPVKITEHQRKLIEELTSPSGIDSAPAGTSLAQRQRGWT